MTRRPAYRGALHFRVARLGISLLAVFSATLSKPSVSNNFRHGGGPVAPPPTLPSLESKSGLTPLRYVLPDLDSNQDTLLQRE